MKRAHVVGNGPSYTNFNKIDGDDFVVGCNITKINADATTLSDLRLAYRVRTELRTYLRKLITCPVIVNQKVYDWLQTDKGKEAELEVIDIYNTYGYQSFELSSGHYAAMWLIDQGYDEIHVWGVDSYFDNHLRSYTDQLVDASIKNYPDAMAVVADRWRAKWDELPVIIHAPTS